MRRVILGAFLAISMLLMSACGPAATTSPNPVSPTQPPAAGQPTTGEMATPAAGETPMATEGPPQGGTLIVALGSDPETLNSSITSSVITDVPGGTMEEGLVWIDRSYQIHPELAESWDVSSDGLTYTFHLRNGVKWHDGEPFTSADVKYTFENISPFHSRAKGVFDHVENIDTPDDSTVVITLKDPFAPFLSFLVHSNAAIQPKHIYEGTDILNNPTNLAPIGTGPFKFQSWTPGDSIVVVRNPDYWDSPKPYLDKIVFRIIPDSSARVLALKSGEIDYISNYDMNFTDVASLQGNPNFHVELGKGFPRPLLLFFNTKEKPYDNPEVRQALYMAIDRQLIFDSAFADIGHLPTSSIPSAMSWAYNPAVDYMKMYPYDPEKAKQMLDDAGYPVGSDGTRFTARFVYDPAQPGWNDVANIILANWQAIGVKVDLQAQERSVWIDTLYIKKDFDTGIAFYTSSGDPVLGIQRTYICSEVRPAGFTNASQYCNPELDALFEKGATAVTQEERATFYYQAQEIIANDLPTAVLYESGFADAISTNFGNLDQFFASPDTPELEWPDIYLKSE